MWLQLGQPCPALVGRPEKTLAVSRILVCPWHRDPQISGFQRPKLEAMPGFTTFSFGQVKSWKNGYYLFSFFFLKEKIFKHPWKSTFWLGNAFTWFRNQKMRKGGCTVGWLLPLLPTCHPGSLPGAETVLSVSCTSLQSTSYAYVSKLFMHVLHPFFLKNINGKTHYFCPASCFFLQQNVLEIISSFLVT